MMNAKSVNLPYNYAVIDENYRCTSCGTHSYEVPLDNFIPVDVPSNEYIGKYYNPEDGNFYYEPEYINVFIFEG